jgi:hypothetical protein
VAELDTRSIAIQQFNRCWEILDQAERTEADLRELLQAAFTSRYHWLQVGNERNWIISDWMVSRALAYNACGDLALNFAKRANEAAWASEQPDWLRASAAEGILRAVIALGDTTEIDGWKLRAQELVEDISIPEEKSVISKQLGETLRSIS